MQQEFSHDFMIANAGCYVTNSNTSMLMQCSFMKKNIVTLYDIVHSEIPLKDKYWFICKKLVTREENKQIAIKIAEIVLPIYEKRYPNNKAPREAIEAAKAFIARHISLEELRRKRNAAYDAADADAAVKQQLFDYLLTFLEVPVIAREVL